MHLTNRTRKLDGKICVYMVLSFYYALCPHTHTHNSFSQNEFMRLKQKTRNIEPSETNTIYPFLDKVFEKIHHTLGRMCNLHEQNYMQIDKNRQFNEVSTNIFFFSFLVVFLTNLLCNALVEHMHDTLHLGTFFVRAHFSCHNRPN